MHLHTRTPWNPYSWPAITEYETCPGLSLIITRVTQLKTTIFPCPSSQSQTTSWLRVKFVSTSLSHPRLLSDLTLCSSCTCCHSFKFTCASVLLCLVSSRPWSLPLPLTLIVFTPIFQHWSLSLKRRNLIKRSHLPLKGQSVSLSILSSCRSLC